MSSPSSASHEGRTARALLLGLREAARLRKHLTDEAEASLSRELEGLSPETRRRMAAAIRWEGVGRIIGSPFFEIASANAAAIDKTFAMLDDALSIEILEWVLRFRLLLAVYPPPLLHAELGGPLGPDYWQEARRRARARTDLPSGLSQRGYTAFWGMGGHSLPGLCAVGPGAIVIEVGASHGDSTLYLASLCGPTGHVHAFELLPENYDKLVHNLAGNNARNVTAVNRALWDQIGQLRAVLSGDGSGIREARGPAAATMGMVDATTMDQYCRDAELERVDFVKIDAPGGSEHILLGARETIQRHRPRLAITIHYNAGVDYFRIPELVSNMVRGEHKYYIRHYGPIHRYTILYVAPVS
jgi:FkbM family methyltransferase